MIGRENKARKNTACPGGTLSIADFTNDAITVNKAKAMTLKNIPRTEDIGTNFRLDVPLLTHPEGKVNSSMLN